MYQTILTELADQILTITIHRPDKLNALNTQVMDELSEIMEKARSDDDIRSVIITGSGSKAFVAGADISEFLGLNPESAAGLSKKGQDIFSGIENCSKPVVAAVNGFALGGGCELALACHFRIASDNARFGQPEVNLGLIPGYGATQRLGRLIGRGRALELMMTASLISAEEALRYGLVNHVCSQDTLMAKTKEILLNIREKGPLAIAALIRCVNEGSAGGDENSAYKREHELFGYCAGTEDMKEGTKAFLEKRKPVFRGK
jgi:enoyl-CoA hydratase